LVQIGISGATVTFKGNGGNSIIVGTMTDPNDSSSFTPMQEIALSYNFEQYTVSLPNPATTHIAFKHKNTNSVTPLFIDDISFYQAPVPLTTFNENFDSVNPPSLPNNWGSCVNVLISNTVAEVRTTPHGSAPSQPNSTFIMNGIDGSNGQLDANAFVALVSPLVQIGSSGATVVFWGNGGNPIVAGTMIDPADTSTFLPVVEIPLTNNFEQYTVILNIPGETHIAFKHRNLNAVTPLFIDDISFDQNVPVELVNFSAVRNGNNVTLNWSTATETNNYGFEIERYSDDWQKIGFVPGFGTTTETHSYIYPDNSLQSGKYSYRIKQIDLDGNYKYSDIIEVVIETPVEFYLAQNYPNPFNPSTTIQFNLPVDAQVTVKIFNSLGEQITTLAEKEYSAGSHELKFNAENLVSGLYIYSIEARGTNYSTFRSVKKMMLLK
jgi:sRNA-binding regulator protein Hfq